MNVRKPEPGEPAKVGWGAPLAALAGLACCVGIPILLVAFSGGGIALFAADGWGFWGATTAGLIIALGAGYAVYELRRRSGVGRGRGI